MRRRVYALILTMLMLVGNLFSGNAEETAKIYSYDFDLNFHLESQVYPFHDRTRMKGYEDLLDVLELKGSMAWCNETKSFDLNAELILKSNPSTSIYFRLYGLQDFMCISTPLLGPQEYCLENTYWAMYFSRLAWQIASIPLPRIVMLSPYVAMSALMDSVNAWKREIPSIHVGQEITVKQLKNVSEKWKELLGYDDVLINWIEGITSMTDDPAQVERAVESLPDILLNLANGKNLTITKEGDSLCCRNAKKDLLFSEKKFENSYSFELSLPDSKSLYHPYFFYHKEIGENTQDFDLQLSWSRNKDMVMEDGEMYPESMLQLNLQIDDIPLIYPSDAVITANVYTGGYIMPQADFTIVLKTDASGNVQLSLNEKPDGKEEKTVITCSGSVVPSEYTGELSFTKEELGVYPMLFKTTHSTFSELISQIVPHFARGILDFVYEMPVSSCQSIMDDIESYGLLKTILTGLK